MLYNSKRLYWVKIVLRQRFQGTFRFKEHSMWTKMSQWGLSIWIDITLKNAVNEFTAYIFKTEGVRNERLFEQWKKLRIGWSSFSSKRYIDNIEVLLFVKSFYWGPSTLIRAQEQSRKDEKFLSRLFKNMERAAWREKGRSYCYPCFLFLQLSFLLDLENNGKWQNKNWCTHS